VHFLGGAFAGAAPQLLYNSFVELLADAGYTVVATPYKVTFQHDVCARQVGFYESTSWLNVGRQEGPARLSCFDWREKPTPFALWLLDGSMQVRVMFSRFNTNSCCGCELQPSYQAHSGRLKPLHTCSYNQPKQSSRTAPGNICNGNLINILKAVLDPAAHPLSTPAPLSFP